MDTKNNKGLIILIVILTILVLIFCGYFVYNKFIADNNTEEVDKCTYNIDNDRKDEEKDNNENSNDNLSKVPMKIFLLKEYLIGLIQ